MLQIKKAMLALSMLAFSGMNAMQLTHKDHDFYVDDQKIERAFIDKEIRGISEQDLDKLAAMDAYLKLQKMNDSDDYALHLKGRINGGGPILGAAFYWLTKGIGYGVPVVIGTHAVGAAVGAAAGANAGASANIGVAAMQTAAVKEAMAAPVVMGFSGFTAPAGYTAATMSIAVAEGLVSGTIVPNFVGTTALSTVAGTSTLVGTIPAAPTLVAALPTATVAAAETIIPTALTTLPAAPTLAATTAKITVGVGTSINTAALAGVGVGKAIVAKVGVEAASVAVGTATAVTNGAAGYVAAVETAATAAAAIGNAIPWF